MNRAVNKLLQLTRVQIEHRFRELGYNELTEDAESDVFVDYIYDICDAVAAEYDFEGGEEAIIDTVFDIIDGLVEQGDLPKMPSSTDAAAGAIWVAKATTYGLQAKIMTTLEEGE